jgi:hypothetical protein
MQTLRAEIDDLIDRGALCVAHHSADQNCQAMLPYLRTMVPARQLLVIPAQLPCVERDATKTFFEMPEQRRTLPSPAYRQCSSDLERAAIETAIRHYLRDHPEFGRLIVNCMGFRSGESPARSKHKALSFNWRNSKGGFEWWDWLPI